MNALKIGLDWYKDSKGYRLIDYGRYGITVVGNGGKLVPTRPLENDMVFMAFANVDSQPKLLEFVHHYGLLEQPTYDGAYRAVFDATTLALIESRPVIHGEYVEEHLNTARMFRDMLMWIGRKGRASDSLSEWITDQILDKKLGGISIELVSGRGFQMVLRIALTECSTPSPNIRSSQPPRWSTTSSPFVAVFATSWVAFALSLTGSGMSA
jgi:hypothetical protein